MRPAELTGLSVRNSWRSLPAQKCLPRPPNTTTRIPGSCSSMRAKKSRTSAYISWFTALTGGRSSVTSASEPSRSTSRNANDTGSAEEDLAPGKLPSVGRADERVVVLADPVGDLDVGQRLVEALPAAADRRLVVGRELDRRGRDDVAAVRAWALRAVLASRAGCGADRVVPLALLRGQPAVGGGRPGRILGEECDVVVDLVDGAGVGDVREPRQEISDRELVGDGADRCLVDVVHVTVLLVRGAVRL